MVPNIYKLKSLLAAILPKSQFERDGKLRFTLLLLSALGAAMVVIGLLLRSQSGDLQSRLIDTEVGLGVASFLGSLGLYFYATRLSRVVVKYQNNLEDSLENLRLVESSLDAVMIVAKTDVRGIITYANENFLKVSGYSREEILGRDHRIVNSGHHSKEFFAEMWAQIKSGRPWRGVIKNRKKDGSFYWVDTYIAPIKGENGQVIEFISFRSEVTNEYESSESTRTQKELYDTIVNNMVEGFVVQNPMGEIVRFNHAATIKLGLTADQLMGKRSIYPNWKSIHEDGTDYPGETHPAMMALATGETQKDKIMGVHRPNGELRWLHINSFPLIRPGESKPYLAVTTFRDITSQKNVLNEISEANQRLELLASSGELGFWDWRLSENRVLFDERWCRILGYEPKELEQAIETWEKLTHPEDLPLARQLFEDYLSGRSNYYEVKFRMRHKDGHWVRIISKGKITDRALDGTPTRFAGTHFDLTNLENVEFELERQKQVAEHRSKLASVGALAAGVGHEINNPLAIIMSDLYLLRQYVKDENFDRSRFDRTVQRMEVSANRIKGIVSGLRTLSRPDGGEKKEFAIEQVVSESIELVRRFYEGEGIELIYRVGDGVKELLLIGKSGYIGQIIMNLLSNAKDATEGVKNPKIEVDLSATEGVVSLEVSDNGMGIPKESQLKIFEAFYTTKEVNKGSGLGLSLVHSMVEQLGGRVEIQSEIGKGAKFTVKFKAIAPISSAIVRVTEEAQKNLTQIPPLRILVVEDEEDFRIGFKSMLELMGHEVETAPSGALGLERIKRTPFDLVLVDLKMPHMSGEEVLRRLKETTLRRRPLSILMMDNLKQREELNPMLQIASDGILPKPFTIKDFVDVVSNMLPSATHKKVV